MIREWARSGRIANIDPYHLLFMIWATTQHYADFSTQIKTLLGEHLTTQRLQKKLAKTCLSFF